MLSKHCIPAQQFCSLAMASKSTGFAKHLKGARILTVLSRGSCDRGIVAASSIPQGIRGSSHGHGCLWFPAPTASHMEGSRWIKNIERKRSLFEFPHEVAGLEALHFHGEPKQLKTGLPFAFSKLPKQNFFQKIKRLI
jgi:hypothetical protein